MAIPQLVSPDTVLGTSDTRVTDLLGYYIQLNKPKHVRLVLGTQVNGKPHFGTYMVHAITFQIARLIKEAYRLPVSVHIGFLDNTTHDVVDSPEGIPYQRNISQVKSLDTISQEIGLNYGLLHEALAIRIGIPFTLELYSQQQKRRSYRQTLIKSLHHREKLSILFSGRNGEVILRIPCPKCGYFEKVLTYTHVVNLTNSSATISTRCFQHGEYSSLMQPPFHHFVRSMRNFSSGCLIYFCQIPATFSAIILQWRLYASSRNITPSQTGL